MFDIEIQANDVGTQISKKTNVENGAVYAITVLEENKKEEVVLTFGIPILDIAGWWHPNCEMDRSLKADWVEGIKSTVASSAPVVCLFGENGENRLTFALSETKRQVFLQAGVHEEDGTMLCTIRIPLADIPLPYTFELYMDMQKRRFEKSLRGVSTWWVEACGHTEMKAPKEAFHPMYSTWYTFHQELNHHDLEQECMIAKELGFETLILDDGWQTDDNQRGYAYCGDWEVAVSKMGDMREHVKRVHEIGLKYMVWFSVPFVGRRSKVWERFKDKTLFFREDLDADVLDLRYPDVREYLLNIYHNAVKEWNIDGVKLDFIDEFYIKTPQNEVYPEMDTRLIEDAVAIFLKQVKEMLCELNPDIMVEYRQSYVGPIVRSTGNLLRVGDCPESGIRNRVASVDLRLLSTETAIHSDMIMWNKAEKTKDVVRQIFQAIFCTLQLSVRLKEQSEEVLQAIRYWVEFMKQNQEVLQKSELIALEPQNLYPVVIAKQGKRQIQGLYSAERITKVDAKLEECIILNGTAVGEIYLLVEEEQTYQIQIRDCCGRLQEERTEKMPVGVQRFCVEVAGSICLQRIL